jgi:hypothetical protein
MKRHRTCLLAVLGTLAILGVAGGLGQEKTAAQVGRHLPDGGVANPAGKTGFFPNTSGGIDALDLATGRLLWTSKEANRPLLATENRLIVQQGNARQVRILILEASKQGKRVFESQPITFPDWVSVQVAYGRSFRSSARVDINGLWLSWEARAFYAGGARPTPQIEKAARQEASGVARVDLDTGKVEPLDADKIAAGKFFPIPADAITPKAGALTLLVKDASAKNPKNPFEKQRILQSLNHAKEVVWQHEIAAPIFLPPLP